MKIIKSSLVYFLFGVMLSIAPIAVYAACEATIVFEGKTCTLVGQSCSDGVCVCAYNCGPATELPET